MQLKRNFALLLATSTIGIFGIASSAMAGEGGAAGSAAFTINSGSVTGVAVAAAVGKNSAFAGALNTGTFNAAISLGSGGAIDTTIDSATGEFTIENFDDDALGSSQNNDLDSPHSVKIGSASGEDVVDFGDNTIPE